MARATTKSIGKTLVGKSYYIVGLVYYKDAQTSETSGYQTQIEAALTRHGIRTVHALEVTGKVGMYGKKDFIKTPKVMKFYQAASKAKYQALLKDKKFKKLLKKGKETFSK